jgi:hypothetical protein
LEEPISLEEAFQFTVTTNKQVYHCNTYAQAPDKSKERTQEHDVRTLLKSRTDSSLAPFLFSLSPTSRKPKATYCKKLTEKERGDKGNSK